MKELFLFVSSTKTKVSKSVSFFTRSKTTHAALCLNGKMNFMYTFGRKTLKPFPAGFVHEDIRKNILNLHNSCNCEVYRFEITDEAYDNLLKEIDKYEREIDKYKYAVLGVWLCLLRIKKTFKYKRFCSQFVANLLSDGAGIKLPYDTSLMRPKDFIKMDIFEKVYSGTIKDLATGIDNGTLNFKRFQD
ncbi:MAG: hypothetical protein IJW26_00155 [Clostridia bacterium]|nr:hypothetical protein [Clostridia bacterium]